mgnify:FL=1
MIADILIKIGAVLALLAALFFGEQYIEGLGYDRRAAEDNAAMETQKGEAAAKLATLTQEKLTALAELANLKSELEKNREDLQSKNAADLRARRAGPSLRFVTNPQAAGCGRSGGGTESPAPGSAPDAGATVVQLPRQISDDLWQLAADAESLKIDYGVLYGYVHNPRLVCELRQ